MSEECSHENTTPSWNYVSCTDCGAVKPASDWGVAGGKWFANLAVAVFYKDHGRMPEPVPSLAEQRKAIEG